MIRISRARSPLAHTHLCTIAYMLSRLTSNEMHRILSIALYGALNEMHENSTWHISEGKGPRGILSPILSEKVINALGREDFVASKRRSPRIQPPTFTTCRRQKTAEMGNFSET